MLVEVDDDELSSLRLPGVFPPMSETPGRVRHAGRRLGADNEAVLGAALHRSPEELASLRDAGVI
jgi:crotonobetainyl-CoA:carnitine CoA-transferase CaiB-like acyl-CoA transferase